MIFSGDKLQEKYFYRPSSLSIIPTQFTKIIFVSLFFLFFKLSLGIAEDNHETKHVPRTILAVYYKQRHENLRFHPIHTNFEMPLNHLGLKLRYCDLENGLPDESNIDDIRGILAYFNSDAIPDPETFISWANDMISKGKKFVLLGSIGFEYDLQRRKTPLEVINSLLKNIGLLWDKKWQNSFLNTQYLVHNSFLVEFEKKLSNVFQPFPKVKITSEEIIPVLATKVENEIPDALVTISKTGSYATDGFFIFRTDNEEEKMQWRLNPFEFFRKAFETDDLPKADTTTLSGRRIFYAHIDGDGWTSVSEAPEYKEKSANCAKVITEEIFRKYDQIPITVAPIVADIDPNWFGSKELVEQAKDIFKFPQVSAASHGYTHILYWKYYDVDNPTQKEQQEFIVPQILEEFKATKAKTNDKISHLHGYERPRSYLYRKFNLEQELIESINFVKSLLPKDKEIKLFQWSGDCVPFEKAIALLRQNNFLNINGGDCRFDSEFPSYAYVSPIGRAEGKEQQIYASNSNENTYTYNWTNRFFGFKNLINTYIRTESPIRVKPKNLYFHMYSAEKTSSLKSLHDIIQFILNENHTAISAEDYTLIAEGFYKTSFELIGTHKWLVKDRGLLNTIRFDRASSLVVDFNQSKGVIGQKHYQGSLYVALDPAIPTPIIALEEKDIFTSPSPSTIPYLVESNWNIWDLKRESHYFQFKAKGYDKPTFHWVVPKTGTYEVKAITIGNDYTKTKKIAVNGDYLLKIDLDLNPIEEITFIISETTA